MSPTSSTTAEPSRPVGAADASGTSAERPAPRGRTVRRKGDRGGILTFLAVGGLAVGVIVAGAATGWFGLASPSGAGCSGGVPVQGAGAAFPAALVSNWVAEFQASSTDRVNYNPAGAGQGISLLSNGLVDFAVTDEGLTASERTSMIGQLGPPLTLPVLGGAVAVVYNLPGFVGPLNLTGVDLARIYLGSITSWNDPQLVANNPGLAGETSSITTVHRSDPAGMTYVLTDLLSKDDASWASGSGLGTSTSPSWPSAPIQEGAGGNAQMIQYLRSIPGAIGYTDLFDALAKSLASAAIGNPSGTFVLPTVAATRSAIADLYAADPSGFPTPEESWASVSWVNANGTADYPLAAMVYFLVPQHPSRGYTPNLAEASALVMWLTWALTAGQSFNVSSFPFVGPPPALLVADFAAIATMTFDGQAIPWCA